MSTYEIISTVVTFAALGALLSVLRRWERSTRDLVVQVRDLSQRVDRLNALLDDTGVYYQATESDTDNVVTFPGR